MQNLFDMSGNINVMTRFPIYEIYCEINNNKLVMTASIVVELYICIPSKHDTLKQCCFNVGPASRTLGQR